MNYYTQISSWAIDEMVSLGYEIKGEPEELFKTPWSTVMRFLTSQGAVYLKQTPPALSLEPEIIQLLSGLCHAAVPDVIAVNDDMHAFLMKDAGSTAREILKSQFNADLLTDAVTQFAAFQQSTESHLESFIRLGVPDWRLNQLPALYEQMINRRDFLKAEGMSDEVLQKLQDLRPQVLAQCDQLARCGVPETIVQPDFNTNNVLRDPKTQALTFIDLGEIVISHPFFSLLNYLLQATIHDGVKEGDALYQQLQQAGMKPWLEKATEHQLAEAFMLAKQLWPIYNVLALYRLMMAVDLQAFKTYYAHRPKRIRDCFMAYMTTPSPVK